MLSLSLLSLLNKINLLHLLTWQLPPDFWSVRSAAISSSLLPVTTSKPKPWTPTIPPLDRRRKSHHQRRSATDLGRP